MVNINIFEILECFEKRGYISRTVGLPQVIRFKIDNQNLYITLCKFDYNPSIKFPFDDKLYSIIFQFLSVDSMTYKLVTPESFLSTGRCEAIRKFFLFNLDLFS